jgi:hypothetical protein
MSPRPRRQFGIRALLALTAACAALFSAFRWLGLTPGVSLFVAAIPAVALAAAISLVVALARSAISREPQRKTTTDSPDGHGGKE